MSGMAGMQETNGATTSAALMDSVREEMARSRGMKAEELKAAIPMHRQMTANMLAQMNADMRSMNMTGDPAWTALVDSLRRDLVRLADIPAADVAAVFPGHEARVNRLIAMHQQMMKR